MKSDNKNSDKNLNKDINRSVINERFPISRMTKGSRKDAAKVTDDSDIEPLADDVSGNVSSRTTSSSPDDIAGVADLDNGMRRAKDRK